MTKVVIQVSQLGVGGVELRTLEVIKFLKNSDPSFSFIIYAASGKVGVLDEEYEKLGAKIVYARYKTVLLDLFILLRKERPDVFHVNASYASGIFCFIAWLAAVKKRVSHIRSIYFPEMSAIARAKYIIYLPLLWLFSTDIVGVAKHAKTTSKAPEGKWITLYDGIDISDFKKIEHLHREKSDNCIKIVFLARYHPCKNFEFAVEVVKEIAKRKVVEFQLVGKFPKEIISHIERSFKGVGAVNFLYHGELNRLNAMAILAQSDILLLTSTREGLPGVILEASSLGLPVLATNLPGIEEIASHIPSVHTLSLTAKLDLWATTAIDAVRARDSRDISANFKTSPFTIEKHVEVLVDLWLA